MWQRVQTIFLVLVIGSMIAMFFFPIWIGSSDGKTVFLNALMLDAGEEVIYFPYSFVGTLAIAAATVAAFSIFKYKNRLTQVKLGALNSLLMASTMVLPLFVFIKPLEADYTGGYGIGLFLPAIGLICNSIANRFIRRDERLVKESDRFR